MWGGASSDVATSEEIYRAPFLCSLDSIVFVNDLGNCQTSRNRQNLNRVRLWLEHMKQLTYWTEYVWSLIPRVPNNNAFSRISRETKSPLLGNPPTRSPKLLPSDRIGT